MQKLLNQKVANAAKPQAKPYQIHDTAVPGLVLRVQPAGSKTWKLIQDRKPRTLGRSPVMTYAMAAEMATAILQGNTAPAKVLTLKNYIDQHYRVYVEAHHSRPKETLVYLGLFKLDRRPLDEINLADVESWRTRTLKAGKTPATINRTTNALKAALQRAYDWELIDNNPLARLKPLKVDESAVVRYLDHDEERRFLTALEGVTPRLHAFTLLAINTGLRRGELWNLLWGDVDLMRGMLTVHGAGAKSKQTRHVPLNSTALETLKRWRGGISPMPNTPVFGKQLFQKSWQTLLTNAELVNFRFHDCRHHFASKLVMAGVPLNTVRELLGHSDLKMTMRYAHLAPDNLRQAVEMLS